MYTTIKMGLRSVLKPLSFQKRARTKSGRLSASKKLNEIETLEDRMFCTDLTRYLLRTCLRETARNQ